MQASRSRPDGSCMRDGGEGVRRRPVSLIAAAALALAGAGAVGWASAPGAQPGGRAADTAADHARRDAALRRAWEDPARRADAAADLWRLHGDPAFRLPVDQAALDEVRRTLGDRFTVMLTPHFAVLSDCDAAWTRAKSRLLERARHQFYRVAGRLDLDAVPHESKLMCVLFADAGDYRDFARAHDGMAAAWAAGYYSTRSNRVVFYNDAASPAFAQAESALDGYAAKAKKWRHDAATARRLGDDDRADRLDAAAAELEEGVERERDRLRERTAATTTAKTIHEAVHLLAYNSGVQSRRVEYPFWISEGLAASFEADDAGGALGPDRERDGLTEDLRRLRDAGALEPLADLVGAARVARDRPQLSAEGAQAMYAQSEALVRHLFRFERDGLGSYLRDLRDAEGDPDHAAMFRRRFGDPSAVERRMMR